MSFGGILILWMRNSARTTIEKVIIWPLTLFYLFIGILYIVQIYRYMITSLELMIANVIKFASCAMAVQRARTFSEYEYKFRLREDLSQNSPAT